LTHNIAYLNGVLGVEAITGLQKSVISAVKHFVANEQETDRRATISPAVSSNIDDRAMHELYMWPFQDAIRAGAGCIMCSYQRLNNTVSCENSKALNGLLKTELGFQGFVVTDWDSQVMTTSVKAGLDMFMPFPGYVIDTNKPMLTS
jgi:beta-glucosidase